MVRQACPQEGGKSMPQTPATTQVMMTYTFPACLRTGARERRRLAQTPPGEGLEGTGTCQEEAAPWGSTLLLRPLKRASPPIPAWPALMEGWGGSGGG